MRICAADPLAAGAGAGAGDGEDDSDPADPAGRFGRELAGFFGPALPAT
jgi:hypothetical protein